MIYSKIYSDKIYIINNTIIYIIIQLNTVFNYNGITMKKQVGRPKKTADKKKSAKVFINLTEEQKDKLMLLSEEEDLSMSQLCLKSLKKLGYI